jgi:hypothetical protein
VAVAVERRVGDPARSRAAVRPQRGGLAAWLLGVSPDPPPGIAETNPKDVAAGTDWSNYLELPPGSSADHGADPPERLGVCFSGGGIRAASFCLGGLQALRSHRANHFDSASYLSAVSGGGYIAVAYAALHGLTRQYHPKHGPHDPAKQLLSMPRPWSLTAPETINLRNHTHYLAPDSFGGMWGVAVALYGAVRRLLPFAALTVLLGTLYGWILVALPRLRFTSTPGSMASVDLVAVRSVATYGCGGLLGTAALLLMMRESLERVPPRDGAGRPRGPLRAVAVQVGGLALAGALLTAIAGVHLVDRQADPRTSLVVALVSLVAIPLLYGAAWGLRQLARRWQDVHVTLQAWSLRLLTLGVVTGLLLCVVPILFAHVGDNVRLLAGITGVDLGLIPVLIRVASLAPRAASTLRRVVTLVAAYVAGPLVLLVAFLLIAFVSSTRGPRWQGFDTCMWVMSSGFFLVVAGLLDDEVRAPLHTLYRERLSTAFIRLRIWRPSRRSTEGLGDGRVAAGESADERCVTSKQPEWEKAIRFSELDLSSIPRLVVCASVNVSDDVVPPGRFAGVFTFEKERCGGPLTGYVPTKVIEEAAGDGVLTLPGMMAISGAAFSPLMGRTTRPGWRLLEALFDVRLGMWLPNPRWLPEVTTARGHGLDPERSSFIERKLTGGSRFYPEPPRDVKRKHNAWRHHDAGRDQDAGKQAAAGRQPRTPPAWLRPGWSYSLREALGGNTLRLRYVYVTDGGHWENLGLVELLRRGCTRIVCFDASEDHDQPLSALGQAITLAKDELNVTVEVDAQDLWPGSADRPEDARLSRSMCAQGTIRYPDGRIGHLVIVKNCLPEDAPIDVRTYAESNARFPMDSTLDQFFDDQRFDAYRSLGHHGGTRAAAILDLLGGRYEGPGASP